MNLHKVTRKHDTLAMTAKNEFYYVAESRFHDCTIEISGDGNKYSFNSSIFESCRFVAKRKITDFRFTDVKLRHCTFKGTYSGAMFGYQPEPEGESEFGEVAECDFSSATLSLCGFLGCDLSTLSLPKWPCFGIVDQRAALKATKKDKRLSRLEPLFASEPYATEVCSFYHAPTLCKLLDFELDLLREFVEKSKFSLIVD